MISSVFVVTIGAGNELFNILKLILHKTKTYIDNQDTVGLK